MYAVLHYQTTSRVTPFGDQFQYFTVKQLSSDSQQYYYSNTTYVPKEPAYC